ncbi:prolyl aminopeptidase [Trichophyton rubrum D6]|uniref:Proline iminopeptidase n=4 Tax=Trichophyton TaxID=5550 RepID=F2SVU5_TRIRC|nr:prolyl aminopeptidase [Trichophyton rubrum CBS 118892]EZF25884.1 prolyl aminopeptidase [Trichophyton rubrum MR850]EZF44860.1 prolyl aminopeptidase [Trichophyton rubrum CBS 100081]EZF55512.1 prolyl aminopeptidase [Trichophyton rubrum CBS 288.86]EZF66093.1 prolyl aminopeptidase [Trichophyton rubrum CBS 289.86]EZF76714.1 prolyl aminopeptidase [Trichophyton soudanense CBS 452.61]EZF87447.1 prolyl aminopeptidase [Trichophyton rubrum MR1448]EZF98198.1 prolyl aminopeptidase [Trichophyton rubrum 
MSSQALHPGYSHADAFDEGFLSVGSIHKIHYEQYGKKDGKPVVFLHGGPGGHCTKINTTFFNPEVYRVVLFDQRGSGKSLPNSELRENTTHHLVEDIEAIRKHMGVDKWHMVFGGSWGSALALVYAQAHPEVVGSLVLRGIFTFRREELEWSRSIVAGRLYPDAYEEFVNYLPEPARADIVGSYYQLLLSDNRETRISASKAWNKWELSISELRQNPQSLKKLEDDDWTLAHASMELHYAMNDAWLEHGALLKKENVDRIRHIPTTMVQGRYDIVCPPQTAYELHKAFPESRLFWIPDAGHSAMEPGTRSKLTETCDEYAGL